MTQEAASGVLSTIVERILGVTDPERIVLFGSRARGEGHGSSDFDLLLIQDSDEPRFRRSVPIYSALAKVPVEVDVVVYTPEEAAEWSTVPRAFVTTALREGRVLYERKH